MVNGAAVFSLSVMLKVAAISINPWIFIRLTAITRAAMIPSLVTVNFVAIVSINLNNSSVWCRYVFSFWIKINTEKISRNYLLLSLFME